MKKKYIVILALVIVMLAITFPYIRQLISLKSGTAYDLIFKDISDQGYVLNNIQVIDYNKDEPANLLGDDAIEVYDYISSLVIKTEFPQKSQLNGGEKRLHLVFYKSNTKLDIFVDFAADDIMIFSVGSQSRVAYKTARIDMGLLFSK